MRSTTVAGFFSILVSVSSPALAADMPSGTMPPIESEPACKWSKAPHGEWLCESHFKLARGEGDPLRVGYCGTVFKAGRVIVTSLSVKMVSRQDSASPFYLIDLYLNRDSPEVTVIGGTFRSEKERPDDVYCSFSARIIVR